MTTANPQKVILIVDDEEATRALVMMTLRNERYSIHVASNGPEALEMARLHRPGLIFLDVMMPELDGWEVCRALKRDPATAMAKVVMLTALAQPADRIRGAEAGADDYFTKPFSPIALLQKVHDVFGPL